MCSMCLWFLFRM